MQYPERPRYHKRDAPPGENRLFGVTVVVPPEISGRNGAFLLEQTREIILILPAAHGGNLLDGESGAGQETLRGKYPRVDELRVGRPAEKLPVEDRKPLRAQIHFGGEGTDAELAAVLLPQGIADFPERRVIVALARRHHGPAAHLFRIGAPDGQQQLVQQQPDRGIRIPVGIFELRPDRRDAGFEQIRPPGRQQRVVGQLQLRNDRRDDLESGLQPVVAESLAGARHTEMILPEVETVQDAASRRAGFDAVPGQNPDGSAETHDKAGFVDRSRRVEPESRRMSGVDAEQVRLNQLTHITVFSIIINPFSIPFSLK